MFTLKNASRNSQVLSGLVSEQFLNGTSAQLGYTVPFTLDVLKRVSQ